MFARKISIHLKPDTLAEFTKTFEQEIMPLLHKQKGFKDQIALAATGGKDVLSISLWETQQDAETYASTTYPIILKKLDKMLDGVPKVGTPDVLHTTFYEVHAAVSAA